MRELSLNVLDIAQNSISAGADVVEITVEESTADSRLMIIIGDNGCGMDEETVKSVMDPFYTTRTTRKVGMGVPLFKMAAEMTGGSLEIESSLGKGTQVKTVFCTDHVDFTPLGDIESTIVTLITMNADINFIYTLKVDGREFRLSTQQLKEILGDVPLDMPEVVMWLKEYLNEQTQIIRGGSTQ